MAGPDLRTPEAIARAVDEAAAHYRQGRLDDADKICTRVLKAAPDWFDALHLAALVKLEAGKAAAAQVLLSKALKLNPGSAPVLANLGRALSALHRDDEAMASVDKALALAPDSFDAVNIRGNVLLKLNRATEAVSAFERVLTLEPRFLGARANLGNALAQLGRFEEALAQYDLLLAAHPDHPEMLVNRGSALASLGRLDEALAAYDRALALRADYTKARIGRGATLAALNRHQDALHEYGTVLATNKNNADVQHNEALSLLTLGDYRRGFQKYEARWLRTGMPRRKSLGKPLWLGEYPLARKTILIHAEQGLGDTIQFARYAPLLARAGAKVVLEVQPELTTLLARLDGVATVVGRGDALPSYDVHCPIGSLPLALRTDVSTTPASVPYLAARDERVAKWRERIERLPSPRIAVAWSGRVDHANDRNRSITLERFAPLLAAGQGSFVSIQRELRSGDADTLAQLPNVTHVGDGLGDFDDTAAVMALADLVVAVDTSVVHLAGAMGRPVWVLLPFQPDWRWLLDREDSPWYPAARLFRQPRPGDWESVIGRVREELSRALSERRKGHPVAGAPFPQDQLHSTAPTEAGPECVNTQGQHSSSCRTARWP
ncbi:MAG: tetratricopeptide repeat protein [Rhodospirillales bacterium]|nr:tetratricopeptide repeat protein [Rhodospirillales bacterium]